MPPRLNKRQQREQEELMMLSGPAGLKGGEEESEAEDAIEPSKPSIGVGFGALLGEGGDADDSEEDVARPSKSKKKKKKKTTATSTPAGTETPVTAPPPPAQSQASKPAPASTVAKKDKKAAKKARTKEKKDDRDDLDKALAELSVKHPEFQEIASTPSATLSALSRSSETLSSLLAVSPQHLDADAELRRFFGSKVIAASKTESGGSSGGGGSGGTRRGQASGSAQRSVLTKPKKTWWPASAREGLSLKVLTAEEMRLKRERHGWNAASERWWTVEYSKKYKSITMAFMKTVMSGDPEGFYELLRPLPYHADTLLQLSEGYRYREEHSTAMDMIDRALFAYERAFVGASNLTAGNTRIDFDAVESRPFFLAIHRQVIDLQRRGCFRTALEFGKLLYSLDPWTDPHGALLHLDYLAIKAGCSKWLLDLWDFHAEQARNTEKDAPYKNRMNITALPGWAYARALALRAEEDSGKKGHDESTAALREAILTFPTIVPLLADKADVTLSSEARAHRAFRIYTDASSFSSNWESVLHILSHLYAQRSAPLWKIGDRSSWFAKTVSLALPDLPSSATTTSSLFKEQFDIPSLAYSAYRHLVVQEASYKNLLSFVPKSVTNASSFAGDPLPPPTRTTLYDTEFFRGVEDPLALRRPRNRRDEQRLLEQLVPNGVLRGQLQGFFEAHPQFAERFPGGITQFVQMVGQMDEEVLNAVLIHAADAPQRPEGVMPGMIPGMGFDDTPAEWEVDFEAAPPQPPADAAADLDGLDEFPRPADDADESGGEDEDEGEGEEEEEVSAMPVRLLRNVLNRFWRGGPTADEQSSDEEVQRGRADDDGVD